MPIHTLKSNDEFSDVIFNVIIITLPASAKESNKICEIQIKWEKKKQKNKSVLFSHLLLCCWYGHCSCCCCCRCHSFCMSWTLARIHTHAHIYSSETASWIPINHAHWICHSEFLRILLRRTSMQHCNIKQNTTWMVSLDQSQFAIAFSWWSCVSCTQYRYRVIHTNIHCTARCTMHLGLKIFDNC